LFGIDRANFPRDIVVTPFYYAQQNGSQNFDWMVLENEWAWEIGCLPSNLSLLLKMALKLLILNQASFFKKK